MSLQAGALFSLAGKTALLTGASGFLGRTLGRCLLANGARLVALGRSERLESLTSDARQITRDLTSDMAALSDGPGTADTTDIAGLLAQLTTRITRTERELATLSGSIVALRERIDAASRHHLVI